MSRDESAFWSDVSTKYDATVDAQLGENLRTLVRNRLSRESDLGRLLEIGCGSGFFTETLADRAEAVVATDIAAGMIEQARGRLRNRSNTTFQLEDCRKTSFGDAAFDAAFMALVLQFVDADVALSEMHRVLRPGATLIIANVDVLALNLPLRLMLVARTIYYSKLRYKRGMPRITPKRLLSATQLRAQLESSGFRVESLEQIRDLSCSYNCPINYVRATRN